MVKCIGVGGNMAPQELEIELPQIISNYPRSSIKPGSAPNQMSVLYIIIV